MDVERKIHLGEGVPLNSSGANIFLNTGKSKDAKLGSRDCPVIHLKTEKPSDLGVHINTTFSIASSKKIKLLFILNFMLSVICMVLSCSIAFYYWNEMILMRRQLDMIKDHFMFQNIGHETLVQSALVAPKPQSSDREPRMNNENAKKYFVEDLGEDMLLVDSRKKNMTQDILDNNFSVLQKDLLVVHFNGAYQEKNMSTQSLMGPWVRDTEVSSKQSDEKIKLNSDFNYVTINESGLYLVYTQVVYLTKESNCYFVWAHQPDKEPRLLSTCATGDDSSRRPIAKSQMSCSVQTVARLYKGDTVNIAQREPNRRVWLRPGYSYFGFVKLSS
ncbi:uncharacterized protein LOC114242881 [Bombyx mandarina]|uniref:Uncharacterized protein LOC114242881 n=1 Tax=Bombyx mandarina TaxID=7092 RepID=A0A6J2JL17_BOMMA|nr:uncharacterized protein LOC114242881 [Bombyx mandarina]